MPKDLMDKTTNQIIHEFLGKCWHDFQNIDELGRELMQCSKCSLRHARTSWITLSPDYENDLNAVREAELKAIEVYGAYRYEAELRAAVTRVWTTEYGPYITFALAPAKTRAEAIRRLIEEQI